MATDISVLRAQTPKQVGGRNVAEFFKAKKTIISELIPKHLTPEKMLRTALVSIQRTPQLMECTLESLAGALIKCAALGLEPDTPLEHIYMLPFRNSKRGVMEVQIIIGYKGLIQLIRNSGAVSYIDAQPVFEGDDYDFALGSAPFVQHKTTAGSNFNSVIAAYAVARIRGEDSPIVEWLWQSQIDQARQHSRGKDRVDSPWNTHYDAMARKTAIRRIANRLPKSTELADALDLDRRSDMDESQSLDNVLDGSIDLDPPAADPGQETK